MKILDILYERVTGYSKIFDIYFRLRPFRYFVARHKEKGYLCVIKKEWDGYYYWEEI